jgi:hypothetical protein
MLKRRVSVVAIVVGVVVLLAAAMALVRFVSPPGVVVVASSSALGTSPDDLVGGSGDGATPVWRSMNETEGSWVEMRWERTITVGEVTVQAGEIEDAPRWRSVALTFDDGASILLTSDDAGTAHAVFPARDVSSARLTFADVDDAADDVALAAWNFDGGGAGGDAPVAVTPTASTGDAAALSDGNIAEGAGGEEWIPDAGDAEPSVRLSFGAPRVLSSAQIVGPSAEAFDPSYSAAAELHGKLVFDDGSEVAVSGIAAGEGEITTIAFMPRVASSVSLQLERTIDLAEFGLREFAVYDDGTTPPRWPLDPANGVEVELEPDLPGDNCQAGPAASALALLCPTPGSAVEGEVSFTVQGVPTTRLSATGMQVDESDGAESLVTLDTATTDDEGVATFTIDTTSSPSGPIAIRVEPESGEDRALYVQLFNLGGVGGSLTEAAPAGMTLQWEEEFETPLSITATGEGAVYAATKPAYWGASEFGAAVFADPAEGYGSIATVGGEYLRIRAQPLPDGDPDPLGYGRQHAAGILSSLHVGAEGFSAQYGYYEARMLGAPGLGTWPAFWMLNAGSATRGPRTSGEVDAVELYGHNTSGSCHSIHNWVDDEDQKEIDCLTENGFTDWALTWHTYGVRIMPNGAQFFIDGEPVSEADGLANHEEPFYFMVNLALDGGWPVDLAPTQETSDLYVDWVRVYT